MFVFLNKAAVPKQRAVIASAARIQGDISKHLLKAMRAMRSGVSISALAKIIPGATVDDVYGKLGAGGMEAITVGLAEELNRGLVVGAKGAAKELGKVVSIDLLRPEIGRWMEAHMAELVTNVGRTTREALKETLEDGFIRGRHPTKIAVDLKRNLTLLPRQSSAVDKFFYSQMADGVSEKIAAGRAQKYADRLLKQRAEMIARTETMSAINSGRQELWMQLKEDGALPENMEKEWVTAGDHRVDAKFCAPVNGDRVAIDEVFANGLYTPPAHPNCRCTTILVQVRLKKL